MYINIWKLVGTTLFFGVLAAWVWLMQNYLVPYPKVQMYATLFVLAPLCEEFVFRKIALEIGRYVSEVSGHKMWLDIIGLAFNLVFIIGHMIGDGNLYFHVVFQGALGWICWTVAKRWGWGYAVMVHVKYNLFVYLFL